ncbi:MAG: FGGY-family carbohydrate kinase [Caldilineaceae bacterium]
MEKFAADLRNALLNQSPEQILEAAAAKVPPGALGLMLVPYWNNVMNPYWDPAASGIMLGWNGAHGREHFYRAILEGIAFEQRLVGDAMIEALKSEATPHPITEYVTMGGGSRSALWCQIMADITGRARGALYHYGSHLLGPAILAAAGVGWYTDARQAANAMTGVAERFEPNPEQQALYESLYQEVYRQIFPTVQPLVDRLTELTHGE